MKEYIEREAAMSDEFCEGVSCRDCPFRFCIDNMWGGCKVAKFIEAIPAADVVEKKVGTWILHKNAPENYWECSNCHAEIVVEGGNMSWEYCPHCGSKMPTLQF